MSLCSASSSFTDIPAYTKFHVAIGFTAVAFAAIAFSTKVLTLCGFVERRIPSRLLAAMQIVHPIAGGGYVICAIFMPITANWIWPRLGTPTMVRRGRIRVSLVMPYFPPSRLGHRLYLHDVCFNGLGRCRDSHICKAQRAHEQAGRKQWNRDSHVGLNDQAR